jgi:hypothetical protein
VFYHVFENLFYLSTLVVGVVREDVSVSQKRVDQVILVVGLQAKVEIEQVLFDPAGVAAVGTVVLKNKSRKARQRTGEKGGPGLSTDLFRAGAFGGRRRGRGQAQQVVPEIGREEG